MDKTHLEHGIGIQNTPLQSTFPIQTNAKECFSFKYIIMIIVFTLLRYYTHPVNTRDTSVPYCAILYLFQILLRMMSISTTVSITGFRNISSQGLDKSNTMSDQLKMCPGQVTIHFGTVNFEIAEKFFI